MSKIEDEPDEELLMYGSADTCRDRKEEDRKKPDPEIEVVN